MTYNVFGGTLNLAQLNSVLLWWRCDTLCTSGFVDDVTFGRNGPYGVFQHRGEV